MVRKPLLKLWREARRAYSNPVEAWGSIVEDPAKATSYSTKRGLGGFIRSSWDEVNRNYRGGECLYHQNFWP